MIVRNMFAVLLAVISGLVFAGCGVDENGGSSGNQNGSGNGSVQTHEVIMRDVGFEPVMLGIEKEERVVFVNRGSLPHWPAIVVHPTHAVYPGSNITKCSTSEEAGI